jgi:hypothetical protein
MKTQRALLVVIACNVLLLFVLANRTSAIETRGVAPVLRGRALELVDDRGRVRASISILPADPSVKMPDGTTGYPETVLLRLITSDGRPNVKIAATERGSAMVLSGGSDPTYVQILAEDPATFVKLSNHDGRERVIRP